MENITKYLAVDIGEDDLKAFTRILKQYKNLIDAKNFSEVYDKLLLFRDKWASSLFTLLCVNNDINPFMHTNGKIPAFSLNIAIEDARASSIANKLSKFLSNLPSNTTIQGVSDCAGCYEYFQFKSIAFNNICKIQPYGLHLQGNSVKLNNNNSIIIDEFGLDIIQCNTLHIDAKYLDIYSESIEGAVSDLYLNVDDILCEGISYKDLGDIDNIAGLENFTAKRIFVSRKLVLKYSCDFFEKVFNCNEVGYI